MQRLLPAITWKPRSASGQVQTFAGDSSQGVIGSHTRCAAGSAVQICCEVNTSTWTANRWTSTAAWVHDPYCACSAPPACGMLSSSLRE